jgi:hypothetical protein
MRIEITCEGNSVTALENIKPFQGQLKDLSETNYKKLKKEILELGFSEPISVWKHKGSLWALNGHQRIRALSQMQKEGIEVPALPINYVSCKNEKEAKRKVLALTSQYGEITKQGLYEFMHESEIDFNDMNESFRFPEIDFEKFELEFFESDNLDDVESEDKEKKYLIEIEFPNETLMHEEYEALVSKGLIVRIK